MKDGKVLGPSEVRIEMLKLIGVVVEEWILVLLKAVWEEEEMPGDWRVSLMVNVLKQKGNIVVCSNYRVIRLREHLLKVLEGIPCERL